LIMGWGFSSSSVKARLLGSNSCPGTSPNSAVTTKGPSCHTSETNTSQPAQNPISSSLPISFNFMHMLD
jgi:hypothetical protein